MATLILFNKPFKVLSQFTDDSGGDKKRATLAEWINIPSVYPAGRLDYDSEGLLILTDNGQLQHRIASPSQKLPKTYWVQVEGDVSDDALDALRRGVTLKDGVTQPAKANVIPPPPAWPRTPPVRYRETVPTSWISLTITEGKNRQVRRMTAAVGFPTLRLIRYAIGDWTLDGLQPGEFNTQTVHAPTPANKRPGPPSRARKRKPGQRRNPA